uniref:MACPF domain-containing protein n=1 Tax=Leptobrachium leishanense TaxID=445787 RepID=A0A8C5LS74_9ANUR
MIDCRISHAQPPLSGTLSLVLSDFPLVSFPSNAPLKHSYLGKPTTQLTDATSPSRSPCSPSLPPCSPSLSPCNPSLPPCSPSLPHCSPSLPPCSPSLPHCSPSLPPCSPSLSPCSPSLPPCNPSLAPCSPSLSPSSPSLSPSSQSLSPCSPSLSPSSQSLSPCSPSLSPYSPLLLFVKFGQYGGASCSSSLGENQQCKPAGPCEQERIDCGNDFECESGRCIKTRLLCNNDNDCGDNSDELCEDDQEPKPPCRNLNIDISELGRTAGDGVNILGMQARRNPFDNEYFHGICDKVWDGNSRQHFRKPYNLASLVYQTRADKTFASDTFEDSKEVLTKIFQETTNNFEASLSVKFTPTEAKEGEKSEKKGAGKDLSISGNLGINQSKNESLHSLKSFLYQTNKTFFKVTGSVQLATFQMRTRNPVLSQIFLEDLQSLPPFYEKADYFSLLEMYGTHYAVSGSLGGKYELVYVLDSDVMKAKGILAFRFLMKTFLIKLFRCINIKNIPAFIYKILSLTAPKRLMGHNPIKKAVIQEVIPFVEGGTLVPATALGEKLAKDYKDLDVDNYVRWAATIVDAPAIIKLKSSPIYTLIPPEMKDSYTKRKNLERATEEYIEEHSTCKCQPCQNGGTIIVLDGECLCKCSIEYSGIACQIVKPFKGE